jgi:hypothetical protein
MVVGLLALLTVVACENNVPGIFHTLATESPRDNRNLHDHLTVSAVVQAGDYYYVAAHGLWSRPIDRASWQEVRRPQPGSTAMPVLAMAESDGTLCAGTENGVYHADANPQSPQWRQAGGISGQILRVFVIPRTDNSTTVEILAITQDAGLYVSDDDCVSFSPVSLPDGATATGRPFDAFHDGNKYWLTVGNRVYSGDSLDGDSLMPERTPEGAQAEFRGIWCLAGVNRCLFANHDGEIWERDGNGWKRLGQIELPDDDAQTVPLTLFTQIGNQILIGTRGYGFYQFAVQALDLANVRRGPRSTSQLYRAHITVFASHGEFVFAGTAGDGLSSIEVSTAAKDTGTWDWE